MIQASKFFRKEETGLRYISCYAVTYNYVSFSLIRYQAQVKTPVVILERSEWQYLLKSLNHFKGPPSSNGEATLNISEIPFGSPLYTTFHTILCKFFVKFFTSCMKEEDGQDNYSKQNKSKIRIQIQK